MDVIVIALHNDRFVVIIVVVVNMDMVVVAFDDNPIAITMRTARA